MKKRNLLAMILFTIITFGIYGLYWYIAFQMELKSKTKQGFGGFAHFLVTLVTFGIYALYWNYAAGKRLASLGAADNSLIYLLISLFGFGWVAHLLMQNQANNL